jgi:hypothetical protein
MQTNIRRINLAGAQDLEAAIANLCMNQGTAGFRLAATFVFANELVLIFQK